MLINIISSVSYEGNTIFAIRTKNCGPIHLITQKVTRISNDFVIYLIILMNVLLDKSLNGNQLMDLISWNV